MLNEPWNVEGRWCHPLVSSGKPEGYFLCTCLLLIKMCFRICSVGTGFDPHLNKVLSKQPVGQWVCEEHNLCSSLACFPPASRWEEGQVPEKKRRQKRWILVVQKHCSFCDLKIVCSPTRSVLCVAGYGYGLVMYIHRAFLSNLEEVKRWWL